MTLTGQDLNLLNTEMQGCIVGGCVAMGGDTHCAGGTQNWPDFMNPNVNPRFCQIGMANGLEDPTQYGCTSWGPESCKWTQRNVSWPDTAVCCSLGELGGAPCDNTQYPVAANPSFAVCVKTGYDPAFRKACCFGDATDVALQCDPAWCPYYPQGACTDLFMAECGGASACGRHKFLTPSVTADQGGAPCNAWYLGVKDNAVDGAYWTRSFTDAVTGSVTVVPSSLSLDPLLSVTAEIARYCAAEGATNGECSCYNAVTACTAGQGGTPGCLIAADTGDADGALRRVDVYCNSGFSTTTDAGKWVTLSNTCGIGVGYGAPTLNPGSANPYAPPGGVSPFPAHCTVPACQMQDDDCIFKNLVDLRRRCPPVCLQWASGSNVLIDNSSFATVHVNDSAITCGSWGNGSVSTSPYTWPASQMLVQVPEGYATSFTVNLDNTDADAAASFSTMPTDLFSTLAPLVTLPQSAQQPLALANPSTTPVWVLADAGSLFAGQAFAGFVAAVDANKVNLPGSIMFSLEVLDSDSPANVQIGSEPAFTPLSVPSTRPPNSSADAGARANAGTSARANAGAWDAPRGARGQLRIPSQAIKRAHAQSEANRLKKTQTPTHVQAPGGLELGLEPESGSESENKGAVSWILVLLASLGLVLFILGLCILARTRIASIASKAATASGPFYQSTPAPPLSSPTFF